jgi:ribose transport system ATP-binding protein
VTTASAPSRAAAPAIEARDIRKVFGAVQALDGADFSAVPGEVHALVGENGAGKSTLIKVLCGVIRADAGQVMVRGREVVLSGPESARRLGIRTVFQELTLLPWMTVAENLLLGNEPQGRLGLIQRRRLMAEAEAALAEVGVEEIDPARLVCDLSLAQQQMVEIVRAVRAGPSILFLDEPTSSLAERGVRWLFDLVQQLSRRGACVIFTSHRWKEIVEISDRITIFRNGRQVGTYTRDLSEDEAITLMTGRRLDTAYPTVEPAGTTEPTLEVRSLSGPGLDHLSFAVRKGEIVGVGGLAGQGHRELFLALFGAHPVSGGEILVDGKTRRIRRPRDAIRAGLGIALVPEDRKREGLLLPMTVRDNMTLPILDRIAIAGIIDRRRERSLVRSIVERLQVRPSDPDRRVSTLSGGNQQKVLIGRWLLADSHILLLYDVTRGVDVATKRDIYRLMLALIAQGRSILFYSSETDELAHLCHRVLVLRGGRLAAAIPGPGIDSEEIVAASVRELTPV